MTTADEASRRPSVYWEVAGAVVSLHHRPPGEAPMEVTTADTLHVHLGAPARVTGELAGEPYRHLARPGDLSIVPRGCRSAEQWQDAVGYLSFELAGRDGVPPPLGERERAVELQPVTRARDPLVHQLALAAVSELSGSGPPETAYLDAVVGLLRQHVVKGARRGVRGAAHPADRASRSSPGPAGPVRSTPRAGSRTRPGSSPAPRAGPGSGQPGLDPAVLGDVLAQVNDDYASPLGVVDLARTAGLSPAHFSRAFRQSTGLPPYQYLVRLRVRRAERLLALTDLTIGEVAGRVGFAHQSHLHRHFVRWAGVSPGRFAAEHRPAERTNRHERAQGWTRR